MHLLIEKLNIIESAVKFSKLPCIAERHLLAKRLMKSVKPIVRLVRLNEMEGQRIPFISGGGRVTYVRVRLDPVFRKIYLLTSYKGQNKVYAKLKWGYCGYVLTGWSK